MDTAEFQKLHSFYERELFENILPFWMERGMDSEHGGFFTCFSNRGDKLLHRHKFTWSQGRFVWMMSRLYRSFGDRLPQGTLDRYLEYARSGAEFLTKHAQLPDGSCAFILSQSGKPILLDAEGHERAAGPGETYDTSVYADMFVVYGMGEYALAANDCDAYQYAVTLYENAAARFRRSPYRSDPYPVPPGYEAHGRPMILLETAHELSKAAAHFGDSRARDLLAEAEDCMGEVLDKFRDPETNLIYEMYTTDPEKRANMLGSYINPGHTIESMWFMFHLAARLKVDTRIAQALEVIRATSEVGWDSEHGGFFQFAHRSGGAPRGPIPESLQDAEMIRKLQTNWDNKLWWPHSEALYTFLLAYELTGDEAFLDWHRRVHEYTMRTFPNPDRSVGEWIQIRDRSGQPVDKVVALPVKDPFHITRALILCMDVLERLASRG